jgi:hypothetical protein
MFDTDLLIRACRRNLPYMCKSKAAPWQLQHVYLQLQTTAEYILTRLAMNEGI